LKVEKEDLISEDITMNSYNENLTTGVKRQLLYKNSFINDLVEYMQENNITEKDLNKKVDVKFGNKTYTLTMGMLIDMYCEAYTEDGFKTLQKGGYQYHDSKLKQDIKIIFSNEDIITLTDAVSNYYNFAKWIIETQYNNEFRKYKSNADIQNKGYTILIDDVYYPVNKADFNSNSLMEGTNGLLNPENESINKDRKKVYNLPIKGFDVITRYSNYVEELTRYGELSGAIKDINTFLLGWTKERIIDDSGNEIENPISRKNMLYSNVIQLEEIYNYLISRLNGHSAFIKTGSKFTTNSIAATIYGNLSVVLKQTASLPTMLNEVDFKTYINSHKGLLKRAKQYKKTKANIKVMSGIASERWGNNDELKSKVLSDNLNKISKFFGIPMEKMDESIIVLFGNEMAKQQAQININRDNYSSEDEYNKAIEEETTRILNRIIANTQSNAIPIKISMNRSGASGTIRKALSIFSSDLQNKVSLLNNVVNEKRNAKKSLVALEEEFQKTKDKFDELVSQRQELENKYEDNYNNEEYTKEIDAIEEQIDYQRNKLEVLDDIRNDKQSIIDVGIKGKVAKLAVSTFMSGLIISLIAELMKRVLGKKDWDWDEETTNDFLLTLLLESTVNNLPYVSSFINAIQYDDDITGQEFEILNQIKNTASDLLSAIKGDKDWTMGIKDLGLLLANSTGIPFSNLYKTMMGLYKNFDESGYRVDAILKGYSQSYVNSLYKDSVKSGNTKMSNGYSKYLLKNRISNTTESIANEINYLYKNGYNAMPKSYMESYNDDKGNTVNLTSSQINRFKNYYNESTNDVQNLMKSRYYKTLSQEDKSKYIKKIYDTYYSYAKAKTLGTTADSKLGNLLLYTNGKTQINEYINVLNAISNITESKTKTRKELVTDYVNKLSGYSKEQKLLIMYLSGYSLSENNKKTLSSYLKKLGMDNKEIEEFL